MNERMIHTQILDLGNKVLDLTGKVAGLAAVVDSMTRQWARQEDGASNGRSVIHTKIDSMRDDVTDLGNRLGNLEKAVAIVEPSLKVFNEEKLRDEGARRLGRWLWAGFLTAAGGLGYALHEALGILWHKP